MWDILFQIFGAVVDTIKDSSEVADVIGTTASESEVYSALADTSPLPSAKTIYLQNFVHHLMERILGNTFPKLKLLKHMRNLPYLQEFFLSRNATRKMMGEIFSSFDYKSIRKLVHYMMSKMFQSGTSSYIPNDIKWGIYQNLQINSNTAIEYLSNTAKPNTWIYLSATHHSDKAIQSLRISRLYGVRCTIDLMFYRNTFTKHNEVSKNTIKKAIAKSKDNYKLLRGSNIYTYYKVPFFLITCMLIIKVSGIPAKTKPYKIGAYYLFYWTWYRRHK